MSLWKMKEMLVEMRRAWCVRWDLWGQFDIHYQRKEELFFPIMERYGRFASQSYVGVDDQIRELFQIAGDVSHCQKCRLVV